MENDRIHLYTLIQMGFFAALYMVKTIKAIAIAFPFFILLCIPARIYLLPRIFDTFELIVLDGSPEEVEFFVEAVMEDAEDAEEAEELLEKGTTREDSDDVKEDKDNDDNHGAFGADDVIVEEDEEENETEDVAHLRHKPVGEIVLNSDSHYTPEAFEAAVKRAGRSRNRRKVVSDVSGMFAPPQETNWSHV